MSDTFIGVPIGSIEKKAVPESGDRILLETKDGLRVAEWGEASKNSGNQLSYNIDDKIVPATDIVSFVDRNTGESVNYRRVNATANLINGYHMKIGADFFVRNFEGAFNVKWAGCGAGKDDTEMINLLIQNFDRIYMPAGNYIIKNSGLNLRSNTEIFGDGVGSKLITDSTTIWCVSVNSGTQGTANVYDNKNNIKINGLHLYCGYQVFQEHTHLLNINAATNVTVDNCFFTGFRGDGVYIGSGNAGGVERHNLNISIRNCVFDGVNKTNRNGISIIDGQNVEIYNNKFKNCTASNMPGAIDIEPDASLFHKVQNIVIKGNYFENIGGNVGVISVLSNSVLTNVVRDIFITENHITGCSTHSIYIKTANENLSANITVERNEIVDTDASMAIDHSNGVFVRFNSFKNIRGGMLLSYVDSAKIKNVLFYGNTFENFALEDPTAAFTIFNAENLKFQNNRFHNVTKRVNGQDFMFYFHRGNTKFIAFLDNFFTRDSGTTNGYLVVNHPEAITDENTNVWVNNYTDVDRGNLFKYLKSVGTTAERNIAPPIGHSYYDVDLQKPIFFTGEKWIDANNVAV